MITDPAVVTALAARWHRVRLLLILSTAVLPVVVGLVCVALAGMTAAGQQVMPWWSAIPAVAAAACAWTLMTWLRRNGLTDPGSWLPATTLMTGAQVVLGVLPGSGIALRLSPGAAIAVKALCAFGLLGAGSAGALARLARRVLLAAPIAELGSTAFPLSLTGPSTRMIIGTDRIDWTTRRDGTRLDTGVAFARIQGISTQAAAIVLHTASGSWTVPSDDPATAKALLRRRIIWWQEQGTALVEQEHERYLDLVQLLGAVNGRASADGIAVTVDSQGVTTGIALGAEIASLPPDVVASRLMACLGKARMDARHQVANLVLEYADAAPAHKPLHKSVVRAPART